MVESQGSARGVLGPFGIILIAVLWLLIVLGNGGSAAGSHSNAGHPGLLPPLPLNPVHAG